MSTIIDGAYILVGGESRRLGQDKLFVQDNGCSLLQKVIATCLPVFRQVNLVGKQSDKFEPFGLRLIIDSPEAGGPLAGIIAALEDCSSIACFVTAADLYDLDLSTIERLIASYNGEQFLGISEGRLAQPLCGIYHRSALTALKEKAGTGDYGMRRLVASLQHRLIPHHRDSWRNINTPADLVGLGSDHV